MTGQDLRIANIFTGRYFLAFTVGTFGKNLRRIRTEKGLMSKTLAERAGVTPSMVSRWERKGVTPESKTVAKVAAALDVDMSELLPTPKSDLPSHGGTGQHPDTEPEEFDRDISRGYKRHDVPVVGDAEASTNGMISWDAEGLVKAQVEQWVSRSFADGDPRAYAVRIRGDSMVPRYFPGEIVIAQPRLPIRDGDFACVILVSGERLIKRVFRQEGTWLLKSLNDEYPPRVVAAVDVAAMHAIRHSITAS
jgi:phage repressor protein C with HTH and peptisase S24 domain